MLWSQAKRIKDVDLLGLAKEELQTDVEEVLNNMKGKRHAQEPEKKPAEENKAQTEDPGIILAFLQASYTRAHTRTYAHTRIGRQHVYYYLC